MLPLLLGAVACADHTDGKLLIEANATELHVGQSTTIFAKLADPSTGAENTVAVSWSASPDGIVTLAPQDLAEMVTAVGSGEVLVTASGYDQTQQIGFSVSP